MSVKEKVKKFSEWARGVCAYNEKGEEILDPRPLEVPVGFEKPASLEELVRLFMSGEVQRQLSDGGVESFEDADDFDVEDEEELEAPWQDGQLGPAWTRLQELAAGTVSEPDYKAAKALRERAQAVLDKYDKDGNLKPSKGKEGA